MARLLSNWRSPDGVTNAQALQAKYAEVFEAISKLDALGHRLLKRASDSSTADNFDKIVRDGALPGGCRTRGDLGLPTRRLLYRREGVAD